MSNLSNILEKNYKDFKLFDAIFYFRTKNIILKEIIKYINTIKNNKITVIDVGGNIGFDLKCVHDYYLNKSKTIKYVVIDKDLKYYRLKKRYKFIKYYENDFVNFKKNLKADIIICSEVIEHIWDKEKEKFFIKLNKMLKKNGLLILSTPNGSSILKNIFAIYNYNNTTYLEDDFQAHPHHKGVQTIYQTLSILNRKGFYVKKIFSTTFLFKLNRKIILHRLLHYIFLLLPFKKMLSTNLVYTAVKKENINTKKWYNKQKYIM